MDSRPKDLDKLFDFGFEMGLNKKGTNLEHGERAPSQSAASGLSSASSVLMRQRAKAEAAKVRYKFAKEEAAMLRQQADINVNLKLLKSKRELEAAEAELEAVSNSFCIDVEAKPDGDPRVIHQRTAEYITNLPQPLATASAQEVNPVIETPPVNNTTPNPFVPETPPVINATLNPFAPEFNSNTNATPQQSGVTELTKFIMKKDLIHARFSHFNDKPERYLMWKTGFKNIIRELEVSPTEELDLLCRWLGPESSVQASSLRAAHCSNEQEAVVKIWDRLDKRYGAPELVVQSFQERLEHFPKLNSKDSVKMYELSDLLFEMNALKENSPYSTAMAYLDSSAGCNTIINKLPSFMQSKWIDRALRYKNEHCVMYPPFGFLVEFIREMAARMNDPSFRFEPSTAQKINTKDTFPRKSYMSETPRLNQLSLSARKTDLNEPEVTFVCPLHGGASKHHLRDCRAFHSKSMVEKKDIIMKSGVCFKCCAGKHLAKDCVTNVKCDVCGSATHCTPFHQNNREHGGERDAPSMESQKQSDQNVDCTCTQICGDNNSFSGKSCAKTILVKVYPQGRPEEALKVYAIVDDQSNRSLARSEFFDHFRENSGETEYVLSSCAGKVTKSGRTATGYVLEPIDGGEGIQCPSLIECNEIPNNKEEIPTPAVARSYKHLQEIEHCIPEYDSQAPIALLIGRDMISAHHILDQRLGKGTEPYAQKLKLGWVIVGETCLNKIHASDVIYVNKTVVLTPGRESVLKPCTNNFVLKHKPCDIFERTKDDEEIGLSREDHQFLDIMDKGFSRSEEGKWTAPLPFRNDRPKLPNNFQQAQKRAKNLAESLKRDPIKREHFVDFMGRILENNHAEIAEPLPHEKERWYLPIFGVYHPKKPSKIRVVFDSSAKCEGVSLNDVLLTGPDLTNNLVSVLLKFRKEKIAVTADVEQMFFNFEVNEEHRDFLRFLWFKNNDPEKKLLSIGCGYMCSAIPHHRLSRHMVYENRCVVTTTLGSATMSVTL